MAEQIHEILESTYTKDNLHRKVVLLEEFFQNYYFKEEISGGIKDRLKDFLIDENLGEYLRSSLLSLSDEFYGAFAADNFRVILDRIKEEENNRAHITIYVATLLPPIEVEKLGRYARENIAPGVFIDLQVDGSVVGGCSFVWNGVHHDYSLAYYMDKKRTEIRALLKG